VRSSRWLIFAPVAILALFAQPAKADVTGDWTYSQSQACNGSVEVIGTSITLHGPDYGGCSGQAHWVKIETTIPADVDTIDFTWTYQTNDGWSYDPPQYGINGVYTLITQQNNATGSMSIPVQEGDIFTFRQYSTDSCCQPGHLTISNLSLWDGLTTTTTTVPPTTTLPPTTTTVQETTTTWTTTTSSTTTTTTTTTIAPSTTVPVTPNWTTTTLQTIATIPVEPTMPDPPPTVPLPQIEPPAMPEIPPLVLPEIETYPPETLELPPDVVDTMPYPVDTYPTVYPPDTLPFVGLLPEPPDTMPLPPDMMPLPPDMPLDAPEPPLMPPMELIEELPPELVEALLDAGDTSIPLTEEEFTAVVDTIENLAPEEAVALITQILATAVTADQAEALASNPEVLAVITEEQATEIFETIEVAQLDETQIAELTAAIQAAPTKVRKAFEKTINIFGGFDDYVPTGSNIPVGERRTLIAIAAGTTLTAASSKIKRK